MNDNKQPIEIILTRPESENDKKGELTFGDVFKFIKTAMPRLLIFCLVSLILGGILCSTLYFTSRTSSVIAIIDFNYDGIEDGLDPKGTPFDKNKILAPTVLTAVSEKYNNLDISKLKESITITGITPPDIMKKILLLQDLSTKDPAFLEKINALSYFPTRYQLEISNIKDLKVSTSVAKSILNDVIEIYQKKFKDIYGESASLSNVVGTSDYSSFDYIELLDIYESEIDTINNYLNEKILAYPKFRSQSGTSFNDLKTRIGNLTPQLNSFNSFIVTNGVSKDKDNTIAYMTTSIAILESTKKSKEEEIKDLKSLAETMKTGTIITPGSDGNNLTLEVVSEAYDKLIIKISGLTTEQSLLNLDIALMESRLLSFKESQSEDQSKNELANTKAATIQKNIAKEIELINSIMDDFQSSEIMSNAVKIGASAVETATSNFGLMESALLLFGFLFVAGAISMIITGQKIKAAKQKLKNQQSVIQSTDAK